ncbi:anti-sigma factor [Fodinicola feengrottensis]|uniref:Regulator of SigK n=1 Tax=Fodinicola feengrottensis TaxID=435914 RepID=A0ABN2IL44_9ACTN|nr:anti-sigma factor [Fodinicola feengrottensis]
MNPAEDDPWHLDFELLAPGWALNALEPLEEVLYAEHLFRCPACQHGVGRLISTLGLLTLEGEFVDGVPAELGDRIRLAVAADDLAHSQRKAVPIEVGPLPAKEFVGIRRKRRPRYRLLAAAMALVVVVAGGAYGLESRYVARAAAEQRLVRELEQPRSRLATLATPVGKPVGYLVASGGTVEFIADGLASSPAGQRYWAWAVSGTVARPLAGFSTDDAGPALHPLAVRFSTISAAVTFAISLEPATTTPIRPTQVVASGPSQA